MSALDDAVQKALGAVETIAPKAWAMALKFERVDAMTTLLQSAFAAAIVVIIWLVAHHGVARIWSNDSEYDKGNRFGVRIAAAAICGVILAVDIGCAIGSVSQYLNADVYAARRLLSRVSQ